MRIAIVDESASRAAVIREGLAAVEGCEIFVVTERRGLVARIGEIAPEDRKSTRLNSSHT